MAPAGYEHMRDQFKKEGMSDDEAKEKAARIWNSKHKNNPVGPGKHEEEPSKQLIEDIERKIP